MFRILSIIFSFYLNFDLSQGNKRTHRIDLKKNRNLAPKKSAFMFETKGYQP